MTSMFNEPFKAMYSRMSITILAKKWDIVTIPFFQSFRYVPYQLLLQKLTNFRIPDIIITVACIIKLLHRFYAVI